MGGKLVFPGGGIYHATKHAVEAISDAMRFELKGFGIQVVVIEPGLIKTSFAETVAGAMPDEEGPYADFNKSVTEATVGRLRGPDGAARGGSRGRGRAPSARRSPRGGRRPATR